MEIFDTKAFHWMFFCSSAENVELNADGSPIGRSVYRRCGLGEGAVFDGFRIGKDVQTPTDASTF